MIVESQIFVTMYNAVVNIFVHETFVRLFLPDWCLKEKLMGQNAQKLTRVVTYTGKVPSRKTEPVWDFKA